jgi:signal transduction histidine kinase
LVLSGRNLRRLRTLETLRLSQLPTTYKMKIGNKILGLAILGYLILTTYFTVWSYHAYLNQAESDYLFRLHGIANAVALQIDGDKHENLSDKYREKDGVSIGRPNTDYDLLHQTLKRNCEANMLSTPVYTMLLDSAQQRFEIVVTSNDTPYFRHPYLTPQPILRQLYSSGGTIPMYMDEYGTWLSAFAPIQNKKGAIVGIVMIDEKFDVFINKAKSYAYRNLFSALLIGIPILLLLVSQLRRLLLTDQKNKIALEEAYSKNLVMSEELRQSYEKLESIDHLRKEMIANISHDLRTPLANLSGYIETLYIKRANINTPETEKYLNIALKESSRLKKLIEELFDLSKLESNQVKINRTAFSIAEVVQDILPKYEVACAEKNLILEANISSDIPYIYADLQWMDRILQNLLDNAIRYNHEGGKIIFNWKWGNSKLNIRLGNTGSGIKQEDFPYVFDRYFKSPEVNSTGLGLAIVKKALELHGQNITVESENGWTWFCFSIERYL